MRDNPENGIKVHPKIIESYYSKKRTKLGLFFRKIWGKYLHLGFICKFCGDEKRASRDLLGEGECFWYKRWMQGDYDIPLWMGWSEFSRIRRARKGR